MVKLYCLIISTPRALISYLIEISWVILKAHKALPGPQWSDGYRNHEQNLFVHNSRAIIFIHISLGYLGLVGYLSYMA